jgi:hypothetical protein
MTDRTGPEPALLARALVEEAAKKSGLLWVRGPERTRALWHVWHEGAACLVGGAGEQPLDGLGLDDGATVTVGCRSKDTGGRLVAWPARVRELRARGEEWEAAVAELRAKRLNAPDPAGLADRWAAGCRVLRLEPSGAPREQPGALPGVSHAAVPVATPATTRREVPRALPRLLRGRRGRTP